MDGIPRLLCQVLPRGWLGNAHLATNSLTESFNEPREINVVLPVPIDGCWWDSMTLRPLILKSQPKQKVGIHEQRWRDLVQMAKENLLGDVQMGTHTKQLLQIEPTH